MNLCDIQPYGGRGCGKQVAAFHSLGLTKKQFGNLKEKGHVFITRNKQRIKVVFIKSQKTANRKKHANTLPNVPTEQKKGLF